VPNASDTAARFLRLFAETYALLHRRRQPQGIPLTPEGRGLLLHLAWSGPLTIGDLAIHAERAQSVVSESVGVLQSHALLSRVRDPRDRRRTLVWLTELARDWLAEEREPLDRARTDRVLAAMEPTERQQLLEAFDGFIATAQRLREHDAHHERVATKPQRPKHRRKQ
jgi:DNA-binding MarR family transcriptional regulator